MRTSTPCASTVAASGSKAAPARVTRALAITVALATASCAHVGPPRRFDGGPALARGTPLLLIHGMMVGARPVQGFSTFAVRIVEALRAAGFDARLPALPAIASSEERAPYLAAAIDEVLRERGVERVLIIAHSQGGLDVRAVLEDPRMRGKIAAVATLSTPHGGTELADVGRKLYGSIVETTMNRSSRRIAESRGWPGEEGHARALMESLTPARAATWPPPPDDVPFFSLAAAPSPPVDGSCDGGRWPAPTRRVRRHLFMAVIGLVLHETVGRERSNDGLVPTARQRAGQFLGCVPTDHMGWLAARNGFDPLPLLVELARALDDVARGGDARALDAHLEALARAAR